MNKVPKWLLWAIIITALIGFTDATYLTVKHYSGEELNCNIFDGCNIVTASPYSEVFGFPVALLGAMFYLSVLLLTLFYIDREKPVILSMITPITIAGFLASVWFMYLQFFVIEALCQYCILSAITSTLLFIFGLILTRHTKKLT